MSAANCPEGKRGPSGALGAAQSDPQGGWEASRATGRELCDTGHPVLEDSPEGATAGRSPRPREAEGRLAPETAESHEARSQAQAQRRAWPQCIATWAAFGVAVPLAFFCTLFFRHRKKSVSAPWDGKSHSRAGVGASCPRQEKLLVNLTFTDADRGLSAHPLHPFGSPLPKQIDNPTGTASLNLRRSRRVRPPAEKNSTNLDFTDTVRNFSAGKTFGAARTAVYASGCS